MFNVPYMQELEESFATALINKDYKAALEHHRCLTFNWVSHQVDREEELLCAVNELEHELNKRDIRAAMLCKIVGVALIIFSSICIIIALYYAYQMFTYF